MFRIKNHKQQTWFNYFPLAKIQLLWGSFVKSNKYIAIYWIAELKIPVLRVLLTVDFVIQSNRTLKVDQEDASPLNQGASLGLTVDWVIQAINVQTASEVWQKKLNN